MQKMNDAEYAGKAEDDVISRGQNDTSSWEVTYDLDFTDRVFEAVNSMRDAKDSVEHYRMHLRHYQEEVSLLKAKATRYEIMHALAKDESDKLRLQNTEMKESLRQLSNSAERYHKDSISFQPTTEDIQERQAQLVTAPPTNDAYPHRRAEGWLVEKIPFDQTFPCIAWATSEESPEAGDKALLHYIPPVSCSDDEIPRYAGSYNGVWLSPTDEKGLAKAQLISLNNTDSDFYPSIDEIQERQARDEIDPLVKNQCFADAVKNPFNAGPHKYSSGDKLWATAYGGDAVYGLETEVRVRVWDGDVPTNDTVDHKGVWLDSAANGELAKVQIISAKEQHGA